MRRLLRMFTRVHTAILMLSGGRIGSSVIGMPVLMLTTIGRRSGKRRSVALGYLVEGDAYVVIASYGGSPRSPAWRLNLLKEPRAAIQVKSLKVAVTTREADGELRERLWARVVAQAPLYQKYQDRTNRVIPVVLLTPEP